MLCLSMVLNFIFFGCPCFIHERLTSLFIVSQTKLIVGKSRPISQAGNPRQGRFTIETLLQRERRLEIQREQRRRRRAGTSIGRLARE